MLRDVQVGLRSLAANPAFALVAIMSLAVGIMAATAIYSVLHAVVIDPFPYKDVDRLMSVLVSSTRPGGGRTAYSVDQFIEIADRNTVFEGLTRPPSATSSGRATAIHSACGATMAPSTR